MQLQMEWGFNNLVRGKWKIEWVKRKTISNWSRVLQITLKNWKVEKGEEWACCLEEFWSFNVFDVAKLRFRSHQLIKISMIYLYIKPEVKRTWCNSNDYSYKWNLYWRIIWKWLFGERNFSDAENEQSFG